MSVYTTKLDAALIVHYNNLFKNEECLFQYPQYTYFQAKNPNWQVTFYKSGKVVVQGKDIEYVVKKFFDESYANGINLSGETGEIAQYPHIGSDESGKGDFFGPLVIAGCYLNEDQKNKLKALGATDSKKLDDKKILNLEKEIKENSVFEVVVIGNKKYNEMYAKIKNLNKLLSWGHCTVLENLILKTNAKIAVLDKFADEHVIQDSLKQNARLIKIIQQPKAEADTAVACASILARAEFVRRISLISREYEMDFPKGAGENVHSQGRKFVEKYGLEELKNVSKTHFKTYEAFGIFQKKLF